LLDAETLKPHNSRYAKHLLDALSQKGQGQAQKLALQRLRSSSTSIGFDRYVATLTKGKELSKVRVVIE
jgi:hypothetical protein